MHARCRRDVFCNILNTNNEWRKCVCFVRARTTTMTKKGKQECCVCVVGWKIQIKIVCWWQIFMMFSRFFHPTLSVDDILNTFQHTKMFSNFPSPNSKRKREKNDADDEEKKRKFFFAWLQSTWSVSDSHKLKSLRLQAFLSPSSFLLFCFS